MKSWFEAHYFLYHLNEKVGGKLRHDDTTAGALQTCCVLLGAEYAYLAVRATVCFQTLEGLLTIVQAGRCHVDVDILIGRNLNLSPLSVVIVATNIVVCGHVAKGKAAPIQIFHNTLNLFFWFLLFACKGNDFKLHGQNIRALFSVFFFPLYFWPVHFPLLTPFLRQEAS